MKEKWKWLGGRLCRGNESLSISEAYAALPRSQSIATACWNVLNPYYARVILEDKRADYFAKLSKKRIAEGIVATEKIKGETK